MTKRLSAIFTSVALALAMTGCSSSNSETSEEPSASESAPSSAVTEFSAEEISDDTNTEEGATAHISPMEKITVNMGSQISVNETISRKNGSNTIELPIAD